MTLETMAPNPVWVADAYADTVDTLDSYRRELTYKVWGGDWCKDCRSLLPDFGAALDAAEVPESRIEHYPVDQDKGGEGTDEYGIEYIPTVVVEDDSGEEVARFVEDEGMPIAVSLADQIEDALGPATDDSTESEAAPDADSTPE